MKRLIFFIPLFLFMLVGCEKKRSENNSNPIEKPIEYERTVWINPDVECCGVKNPINNLEWLKELYKMYKDSYFSTATGLKEPEFIFLFQNDITQENFVVIDLNGEYSSWITIYDCSGNKIDGGVYDGGVYSYHQNKNSEHIILNNINATPPSLANAIPIFSPDTDCIIADTIGTFA